MLDIKNIQRIFSDDTVLLITHCKNRCIERGITFDDIKNTILNGEIIKQYEDDKPFPSCLVLGLSNSKRKLHVVISTDNEYIYVITAYYPNLLIWNENYKTKRRS